MLPKLSVVLTTEGDVEDAVENETDDSNGNVEQIKPHYDVNDSDDWGGKLCKTV